MSIPTMSFENLRDIIANPENVYSRNKSFQSDNKDIKQFTTAATDFFNMINNENQKLFIRIYFRHQIGMIIQIIEPISGLALLHFYRA